MEKETYSKAIQADGYQSKGSQAEVYPRNNQPTSYETFGDMFQSYYYNPQSYLEGLKYHMKEHMNFGEQSAALQAIYGPQLRKVHPTPPPPSSVKNIPSNNQSGATLDLSENGLLKTERLVGRKDSDDDCPSYQCLHSSGSSSSSSSPVIVKKGKLDCFYCDFSHLQPVDGSAKRKQKPERFLPCDKCDYFTALSSSLKSHMLKHSDERPLKCSYCDYTTKHTSALKLHITKHTGILQYSCDQCSYRTASSSSLKSHLLKHTDVKHLQCPFCDYSTKHKNALKMHMCKHNGILEHACPHCDYRSASASCLKSHMLKHSDVKPQKCAYCDYATKHKSALRNHLKKHATLPFCHVII